MVSKTPVESDKTRVFVVLSVAAVVLLGATYLSLKSSPKETPKTPKKNKAPNEILNNLKALGLDKAKMSAVDLAGGDGAKTRAALDSDYFLKLINFIGQTVNEELSAHRLTSI